MDEMSDEELQDPLLHDEGSDTEGIPSSPPSEAMGTPSRPPGHWFRSEWTTTQPANKQPRNPYFPPRQKQPSRPTRKTAWIVIDSQGRRSFLHADKRSIVQKLRLNIPHRDMRLLDRYEHSKILLRDKSLIFAIEHVRLIITSDIAILPREGYDFNPSASRFVDILEEAVAEWVRQQEQWEAAANAAVNAAAATNNNNNSNNDGDQGPNSASKVLRNAAANAAAGSSIPMHHTKNNAPYNEDMAPSSVLDFDEDSSSSMARGVGVGESLVLPFELVVLEAALKESHAHYHQQVTEFEGLAYPALDALTRSVNTSTLERVRKVKTRHQRLTLKCDTLREELENFLEDDDDMAKLCLTKRKEDAAMAAAAAAASGGGGGVVGGGGRTASPPPPGVPGSVMGGGYGSPPRHQYPHHQYPQYQHPQYQHPQYHHPSAVPSMAASYSRSYMRGLAAASVESLTQHYRQAAAASARGVEGGGGGGSGIGIAGGISGTAGPQQLIYQEEEDDADFQEVENLFDNYFMQVDGLTDKLKSIDEYITDTEEYINIELDSSRNRLIRLEILLTAATFALAPFNLLAGILGENLVLPESITGSVEKFYVLNCLAFVLCFGFFYLILLYMRYKRLI
jgi:hypothetical protein